MTANLSSSSSSYAEVVQKIELFSSFFDRLLASSPNYQQHVQNLAKFKTALYSHAKSPTTLDSHIEELLGSKVLTPDTSSIKSHPNSSSESKPSHKISMDLKSEPNSMTSLTETLQMLKENPNSNEANAFASDYRQSINDLITIFQLLSKLRATEHADLNNLFLMAGDYSHVRSFEHPQHAAFLALSFAFYEKLLLRDLKPGSSVVIDSRLKPIIASEIEKQNTKKSTKSAYRELLFCLRDLLDGKNSSNSILLFNLLSSNQEMYGASLSLFKEIIQNISSSTSFSLLSMNEPSNEQLFTSISSLMQSSLRFMSLDTQKLTKKEWKHSENIAGDQSPKTPTRRNASEITIFFDNRSNMAYLLYKSHGSKNSPTAKRTKLNAAASPSRRGFTVLPVPTTLPTPSYETDKRRMTMIPSSQNVDSQNTQFINLIAPSRSDKTPANKPRSLHEINDNDALSSGLIAKGRDVAPVRHTGEGPLYNLNVIPPGSNSASMNLGQSESLVGLSSFHPSANMSVASLQSRTFNEDNLGLLRPQSILNAGHILSGNPSLLGTFARNESILSNVGNLLGDISLVEIKEKSQSNPTQIPSTISVEGTSVNDLDTHKRRLSLKKIPNFIRQSFEHSNKDVQGHETEFNKISETYLKTDFAQPDKKPPSNPMNNIMEKYKTILAKKGDNPTSSSHMQSGMRMDH